MDLHGTFERDGASFWWLDWCCDGSHADAPGLTPETKSPHGDWLTCWPTAVTSKALRRS